MYEVSVLPVFCLFRGLPFPESFFSGLERRDSIDFFLGRNLCNLLYPAQSSI